MSFLKSSSYLIISTLVKVLLGVLAIKTLSLYLGADGFGKLGQFMSLLAIIALSAGGGISNGIISKVSQYKNDHFSKSQVLSAGIYIGLLFSAILGIVLLLFSGSISTILFKTASFSKPIQILAFLQFFNVFSVVFGGYLNGLQRSKYFSVATIISGILGFLGLYFLVCTYQFQGAMLGLIWLAVSPGFLFFLLYFYNLKPEFTLFSFKNVQNTHFKSLLKYSFMLLISACLLPILQIFIRDIILQNSNWTEVGFWQAASKLSESGLVFLNVILANYYLPELGKTSNDFAKWQVIKKAFLILVPTVLLYIFIMYFGNSLWIKLFFAPSFQPAEKLLLWQAIGDALKVLCGITGFLIVLQEKWKIYIFFELILCLSLALLTHFLVPIYGTIGANYAYVMAYFLQFIYSILLLKFYFKFQKT